MESVWSGGKHKERQEGMHGNVLCGGRHEKRQEWMYRMKKCFDCMEEGRTQRGKVGIESRCRGEEGKRKVKEEADGMVMLGEERQKEWKEERTDVDINGRKTKRKEGREGWKDFE